MSQTFRTNTQLSRVLIWRSGLVFMVTFTLLRLPNAMAKQLPGASLV